MLNYCDCGDYCEWCHPEMCGPTKIARETIIVYARNLMSAGSVLEDVYGVRLLGFELDSETRTGLATRYEFTVEYEREVK